MTLIDNINALYNDDNRNRHLQFITNYNGSVSICEPNNASTQRVDVRKAGIDFHLLNQSFYKSQANLTEDKSSLLKDSDCDGVVIYEDNGQKHILAIELKSGFSGDKIKDGYSQIFFTILKLYTLLSLCKDFDFNTYELTAYIACQPVKNEDDGAAILDRINMQTTAGYTLSTVDKVIKNHLMLSTHDVKCKIKDLEIVKGVFEQHFNDKILEHKITFRLFTMPNYGDHQGTLTLP